MEWKPCHAPQLRHGTPGDFGLRLTLSAALLLPTLLQGCAEAANFDPLPTQFATGGTDGPETGGTDGPETGGSSITGGTRSTGGQSATGGADETGGRSETGGTGTTGGLLATGATNETGGSPATGGSSETGGSAPVDACPQDPDKTVPGTCGCGVADHDADNDGTADCEDDCKDDANKTAPGTCGCGTPDIDTDNDSTLDCNDNCKNDPNKTAPGTCGCGAADDNTDSDSDGVPDCLDRCPGEDDNGSSCTSITLSNVDGSALDFGTAPSATLDCGDTTINTAATVTLGNWCGDAPTPIVTTQGDGSEVVVVPLRELTMSNGNSLTITGSRPLIFAVIGDIGISGIVDASASGTTAGPGGNLACQGASGGDGGSVVVAGGGGGGGGFGTAGGSGSKTAFGLGGSGGPGGTARSDTDLVPLVGGCPGGVGGGCSGAGAGAGALQLSATGTLFIDGAVRLNGGNGPGKCGNVGQGTGGGGSGGGLLLEASNIDISGADLRVHGGDGGDGDAQSGQGSHSAAEPGTDGNEGGFNDDGGRGGGGGYGVIVTTAANGCTGCN